jgi:hypothetical protein
MLPHKVKFLEWPILESREVPSSPGQSVRPEGWNQQSARTQLGRLYARSFGAFVMYVDQIRAWHWSMPLRHVRENDPSKQVVLAWKPHNEYIAALWSGPRSFHNFQIYVFSHIRNR